MIRLTPVMPTQQQKPMNSGLPPVLISFTMLLLRPMAAMARTMKNLLSVFTGAKKEAGTPKLPATVVIRDAAMK